MALEFSNSTAINIENFPTLYDPNFTYHYDKVSCMKGAYFAHIVFCYLVFLSGIFAFVTRLIPKLKWTHVWWGRTYIISMLWATATSLIIHNSGLPPATLISFIWVLGGMCVAWIIIKFHEIRMNRAALALVTQQLATGGPEAVAASKDLSLAIDSAKGQLAGSKGFVQRFFSLKAAHGIIMFVSWINIAGRIFASDQSGDFTCHTFPAYKPLDTKHFKGADVPLTLLPHHDAGFARLPWARTGLLGWSLALLLGPLFGAALVGGVYSAVAAHLAKKRSSKVASGQKLAAVEAGLSGSKDTVTVTAVSSGSK